MNKLKLITLCIILLFLCGCNLQTTQNPIENLCVGNCNKEGLEMLCYSTNKHCEIIQEWYKKESIMLERTQDHSDNEAFMQIEPYNGSEFFVLNCINSTLEITNTSIKCVAMK